MPYSWASLICKLKKQSGSLNWHYLIRNGDTWAHLSFKNWHLLTIDVKVRESTSNTLIEQTMGLIVQIDFLNFNNNGLGKNTILNQASLILLIKLGMYYFKKKKNKCKVWPHQIQKEGLENGHLLDVHMQPDVPIRQPAELLKNDTLTHTVTCCQKVGVGLRVQDTCSLSGLHGIRIIATQLFELNSIAHAHFSLAIYQDPVL